MAERFILVDGKKYAIRGEHTVLDLHCLYNSFREKYPSHRLSFKEWLVERGKVYFSVPVEA